MKKATFIGKTYGTGFDRDSVYLEYEYRGHRYEVYENRRKGNEPLSWQHRNAQAEIDQAIELEGKIKSTEDAMVGFNLFWEYVNGEGELE